MHVDSYLEIFTTMYGWALANVISSLIVGTGLVVVPFFAIIFNKWRDAKEQGMQAGGIMSLLESAQTRLLVALFVATVCFFHSPGVSLKSIDLIYQPKASFANPNPQEGSLNNGTGTTFDQMKDEAKNLDFIKDGSKDGLDKVPLWWYTVMAISAGINNAIRDGFKSQENTVTMRELQLQALMTGVKDPDLRTEISQFIDYCHGPAMAKLNRPDTDKSKFTNDASDTGYPWSEFFRKEPGFYDSLQCVECATKVKRYKHDPARDTRPEKTAGAQAGGMPMCKQWWEDIAGDLMKDPEIKRLADSTAQFDKSMEGMIPPHTLGSQPVDATERAKTAAIQTALSNSHVQLFDYGRFYGVSNGSNLLTQVVDGLGVMENRLKSAVIQSVLTSTLPMVQALLLMGIYAFLPLVVFLSGFDLRAMFIGSVALFSVKIFASLWMVAQWMDTKLVDTMYPKGAFGFGAYTNAAQIANGYKETVLSTLLVMLFIGLPLMWTSMLGWISIGITHAIGGMLKGGNANATQSAQYGITRAAQGGKLLISAARGGK